MNCIEPGEHNQNAYIERFDRTYRTEVHDACMLSSIEHVQVITDDWLNDYNDQRSHDRMIALSVPPKRFMLRLTTQPVADSWKQMSS